MSKSFTFFYFFLCRMELFNDEYFMRQALHEAEQAFAEGEIPAGAVVVSQNRVIVRAHNLT